MASPDDMAMWWSAAPSPYQAPRSEFATPGDLRRETASRAMGWDVDSPWNEFARRLMTYLPMAMPGRSSTGARIGNDAVWAARVPRTGQPSITGGLPEHYGMAYAQSWPEIALSSAGLAGRNPRAFSQGSAQHQFRQDMQGVTPSDMGFVGPSAPANSPAGQAYRHGTSYLDALGREELRRRLQIIQGGRP